MGEKNKEKIKKKKKYINAMNWNTHLHPAFVCDFFVKASLRIRGLRFIFFSFFGLFLSFTFVSPTQCCQESWGGSRKVKHPSRTTVNWESIKLACVYV